MDKLTVEQRVWRVVEDWIEGYEMRACVSEFMQDQLVKEILTANTAEDERLDFRGRLAGETNWQQQQREANTAEDEDDDCYCTDENECHYCLENKSDARWLQEQERQITLRKIEEWYKTAKVLDDGDRNAYFRIKKWLQQEEEDG